MRILHIHPSLQSGGIEAMICNLANEMAKRNEVTFCSIFEINDNDVFIRKLDKTVKVCSLHKHSPGIEFRMLWKIYKFIKDGHYDVVHIHGFFYYYFIPIILLHHHCKFFYTIHSDAIMENSSWDKKLFRLKKMCFNKKWMRPVTISKASQASFDKLYDMNSTLIYNGTIKPTPHPIDLSAYRQTPHTKILFHPGRITLAKNQEMLCSNCTKLIDEGYDIALLIAGQNQDKEIYDKISQYFGSRIIYLGERNDVINIMANADAFCLSSIWEGMPITLLEAMSVGCVPICTPVGGIPEVIMNGESGFLAKSNQSEDYYVSLKNYLDTDNKIISEIRNRIIARFEDFNITKTTLQYENLYEKDV